MFTPIVLLTLLVSPYFITNTATNNKNKLIYSGMVGIALVFFTAGIGHFVKTEQMMQMLPAWLPLVKIGVLLIGAFEIILAVALFFRSYRRKAGVVIIALLILFLFVNIYAAYIKVDFGGHSWGLTYLFLRVPIQFVFIFWTYWFCVKKRN